MLAKVNIEQASYWDVHNDMTEQGGDYGYLSRTARPMETMRPGRRTGRLRWPAIMCAGKWWNAR